MIQYLLFSNSKKIMNSILLKNNETLFREILLNDYEIFFVDNDHILRPSYRNSEYLIDIADAKMTQLGEKVDKPLEHHILKKNLVDSNRAMRETFPVNVLKEYVLNKLKKSYELLIWKKNFCKYLTINCFTSKCFFNDSQFENLRLDYSKGEL